jgi:hypothetical protein
MSLSQKAGIPARQSKLRLDIGGKIEILLPEGISSLSRIDYESDLNFLLLESYARI